MDAGTLERQAIRAMVRALGAVVEVDPEVAAEIAVTRALLATQENARPIPKD